MDIAWPLDFKIKGKEKEKTHVLVTLLVDLQKHSLLGTAKTIVDTF